MDRLRHLSLDPPAVGRILTRKKCILRRHKFPSIAQVHLPAANTCRLVPLRQFGARLNRSRSEDTLSSKLFQLLEQALDCHSAGRLPGIHCRNFGGGLATLRFSGNQNGGGACSQYCQTITSGDRFLAHFSIPLSLEAEKEPAA